MGCRRGLSIQVRLVVSAAYSFILPVCLAGSEAPFRYLGQKRLLRGWGYSGSRFLEPKVGET